MKEEMPFFASGLTTVQCGTSKNDPAVLLFG